MIIFHKQHMRTACAQPHLHHSSGFSLIEVLVTIVILGVGLLGLAGLQASALRNSYQSNLRSIATIQAEEIADRMRANREGVINGHYNAIRGGNVTYPSCLNANLPTGCTPQQMAVYDEVEWNSKNDEVLPSGVGWVDGNGSMFTIRMMWDDTRTGATGTGCSGDYDVDLTCFFVVIQI